MVSGQFIPARDANSYCGRSSALVKRWPLSVPHEIEPHPTQDLQMSDVYVIVSSSEYYSCGAQLLGVHLIELV